MSENKKLFTDGDGPAVEFPDDSKAWYRANEKPATKKSEPDVKLIDEMRANHNKGVSCSAEDEPIVEITDSTCQPFSEE